MIHAQTPATPPVAKKIPYTVTSPNGDRQDEYYWLRDDDPKRKRSEIIEYLNAENAYTEAMLAHIKPLQQQLINELRARIKEDDSTVPLYDNGFWYWQQFATGAEYPVLMRQAGTARQADPTAAQEILLDIPKLAQDKAYFRIGSTAVSLDRRWLAWTEDTVGRRMYTLRIKNLQSGEVLNDTIAGVLEPIVWAADNRTLFFIKQDPQTLQSGPVYRHTLGQDPNSPALVYDEPDKTLFTTIYRSASRRYLVIQLEGFTTTEIRAVPSDSPNRVPQRVIARKAKVRSYADHLAGRWIIRSNERAANFRLIEAPEKNPDRRQNWKDIVPARKDVAIDGFTLFDHAIAIEERAEAVKRIRILPTDGSAAYVIGADEPASTMSLDANADSSSPYVRYSYSSLITPQSIFDADLKTQQRLLRKEQPVIGYDKSQYTTERLWARARDGQRIPISIAYRKDRFKRDGSAPLYINGYGSYGYSNDPVFHTSWVSLLDRGFAVAIAHVRGGAEMGQAWYEAGKLLHKKNTFNDFIDVTNYLLEQAYGAKVFASGGSAGGLLMGAVANQAGKLYRGIALHVPFVDIVTTMLDETIPLTTNEYTQWGDPRQKKFYDYMLSYSPYDQIKSQAYPAMLVTAGLWDPQVQYYEPAKYVARLRAKKTDSNPLLMHLNMQAGHSGKSGRFERLEEIAREYAFFLDLMASPEAK